jgi:hypothetical protein
VDKWASHRLAAILACVFIDNDDIAGLIEALAICAALS